MPNRPSLYGAQFDELAARWREAENEHDRYHPDRSRCGGVGSCPMMARAVDLEHEMVEALEAWRVGSIMANGRMCFNRLHRHKDGDNWLFSCSSAPREVSSGS